MNESLIERVRERAHQLWEQEGRPEGRSEAHWQQACDELGGHHGLAEHPHGADFVPAPEHVSAEENPITERLREEAGS